MTTEREQILALAKSVKLHHGGDAVEAFYHAARKPLVEEVERLREECHQWKNNWDDGLTNKIEAERDELRQQLAAANEERAWIRRKLELPEDTGFLSGEVTLAGTMHCVCSGNHGYRTYIETEKCDDKAGLIARLTVQLAATNARISELEAQGEPVAIVGELSEPTRSEVISKGNPIGRFLYIRAPQAVPEGWKLVPIDPTPEMLTAGECESDSEMATYETVFSAMLEAAPSPEGDSE